MILPFLKPIEHLILDDSISEVMVNGPDRVFIEKQGFLQQVPGVSIGEKSLMVVSAILSDDIEKGSIELHQDKAFGPDSAGCTIVEISVTPFSQLMAITWKKGRAGWKENPESSCAGGQIIMHRVPR